MDNSHEAGDESGADRYLSVHPQISSTPFEQCKFILATPFSDLPAFRFHIYARSGLVTREVLTRGPRSFLLWALQGDGVAQRP
jgi:hypothetical protein